MKIALVDDEQACLDAMTALIREFARQQHCQIETVPFRTAELFLRSARPDAYAAVFMDIYLGDGTDGMQAARTFRQTDSSCLLVFLTSSDAFMPEAFSCHAFDYVVKPLVPERVLRVLTDILELVQPDKPYIELRSGRQAVRVFHDEIVSAASEAHYMNIQLQDGRMLRPRMTAKEFAALVGNDPRFLLINKGIIVNADKIVDFVDNTCLLDNGTRFPVRVRDRNRIEQAARDYMFERLRRRQQRRRM